MEKFISVMSTNENYTIYGDETSINWLKFLTIDNQVRLFPDFYSAYITYEYDHYLVLVNHEFKVSIPSFLEEKTINSGAWTAIIDELDIPLKKDIDISKLEELLESEWDTNLQGFKVVNFEQEINGFRLTDCFTSISLYKIISRFTRKEELNQITGIALTKNSSYCLLPYSPDVLKEFKNTFENGNQYIPFENILASYVASNFKFAYLDLYRCIEALQPLFFLKAFYDQLALTGKSLQSFYSDFYETTKLEPKLEDSLNKLLGSISINYLYAKKDNIISGSYLYKLRNQIVHLRPNQKNDLLPKSIDDWNLLIFDMLTIVQELYKANQNLLN